MVTPAVSGSSVNVGGFCGAEAVGFTAAFPAAMLVPFAEVETAVADSPDPFVTTSALGHRRNFSEESEIARGALPFERYSGASAPVFNANKSVGRSGLGFVGFCKLAVCPFADTLVRFP